MAGRANLLDLDRPGMESFFAGLGEKPFHARQTLRWIHHRGMLDFAGMTDLGKALRERLAGVSEARPPEIVREQVSRDGTRKWLIRVDDDNSVETVFIPERDRGTLCVSSQVGCAMNCSFCATAQQGFSRNLGVAEIIGQLWLARRALGDPGGHERIITNVVLMGMGEPLLNFDNVLTATRIMLDDNAYGLSQRRVTLSTAGHVPGIDRLGRSSPISLAVSLHAPDDATRDELVPLNRKYPIAELLQACRRFLQDQPRRRITFEYVMLDGVNDTPAQARRLASLLGDIPAKVNLIPFNPVAGTPYRCSPADRIDAFRDILMAAGLTTITRRARGDDIDAACGQLVGNVRPRARRHQERSKTA